MNAITLQESHKADSFQEPLGRGDVLRAYVETAQEYVAMAFVILSGYWHTLQDAARAAWTNSLVRKALYIFAAFSAVPLTLFVLHVFITLFTATCFAALIWITIMSAAVTLGLCVLVPFIVAAALASIVVISGYQLYMIALRRKQT